MMGDDVGGYQREAGATFGAGTLKRCSHDRIILKVAPERWRFEETGYEYDDSTFAQPSDVVGTRRCIGCGNKVES